MPDGEVNVRVNAEGVEDAAQEFEDSTGDGFGISAPGGGGGGPGGGGGMLGQLLGKLGGMSSALLGILGAVGLVVGLLASLKPVQKMIEGLFKIIQAFVAPLAVMLMRLLSPVLGFLMRLLPIWMDFLSDPQGMIENAMSWLRGALFDMANHLVGLLPNWLTSPLDDRELVGEFDSEDSIMNPERRREILEDNGSNRGSEGGDTNVNLFGGLSTFVDRITRDGTVNTTPAGPGPGP